MNGPVTFVRSEDLLDESVPKRLSRTFRLSRRRQVTGALLAAALLPLLTVLLKALEGQLALDGQVLIYLLAVVVVAVVGGVVVAVSSAIAASLLINFFFVEPVHTLNVSDPDQAVGLIVFVAVAALVSGAVEYAVRRARIAERARAEAEAMAAMAGPDLDAEGSLREILRQAREAFGMQSVALMVRRRGSGEWFEAERFGWPGAGEDAPLRFDVPAGPHFRLIGRGPALFAEDERILEAYAATARTAYEGSRLSGEAEAAKKLATVDEQRTALLAAVGHDLRTPLAAITAAVTSLRQTDVELPEAERDELLATIEDSADQLDAVIRNLLDVSRLRAGALSVRLEPVALDEVVSAALLALGDESARVAVHVAEDLALVRADRELLQRVLVNLLDNAFRHGEGEQQVEVVAYAGAESIRLEVVDHGPGVARDQREKIFEPFQSLDDRGGGGVGLGLAVARGFIEAMGGAMVADTTQGGGLTMRIRLRVSSPKATVDPALPAG